MFGRGSPFDNDPFFRDPFAHMDNVMRSMFNDPFFSQPLMPPGFGFGPAPYPPQAQAYANARLPPPVVEEVDEQHTAAANNSEPVVEEPDDPPPASDARAHLRPAQQPHHHHQPHHQQQQQYQQQYQAAANPLGMFPGLGGMGGMTGGGGMGAATYSFSSSYSRVGGANGVSYSSTTTTRAGPGQVRETQRTVRDGRTGQQSITISRGLGDRSRTITRTRDATGREVTEDHLEAPDELDPATFDQQWAQEAEQNLPTWGARQPTLRLGPQRHAAGASQPQLALPSSGHQSGHAPAGGGYGRPGQRYG